MNIATYPRFSDLCYRDKRHILKNLTFKTGCLRRDLVKHDPPVCVATVMNTPVGIAALFPRDRRYNVNAHGIEVYIAPRWRKNGTGRTLVRRVRIYADYDRCRWWGGYKFYEKVFTDITKDGVIARSGR